MTKNEIKERVRKFGRQQIIRLIHSIDSNVTFDEESEVRLAVEDLYGEFNTIQLMAFAMLLGVVLAELDEREAMAAQVGVREAEEIEVAKLRMVARYLSPLRFEYRRLPEELQLAIKESTFDAILEELEDEKLVKS